MQEVNSSITTASPAQKASMLRGPGYQRLKRIFDFIIVLLVLPICVILLVLIAAAIKLYSPGPIFYRQERIGKNGKSFMMYKFRSMHVGNNSQSHRQFMQQMIRDNLRPQDVGLKVMKLKDDPRITRPGKLLRMISLDELPQFINVLLGDMSIVGPRPPLPYEVELYDDWHKRRLDVMPGITGLWQVTAHNQVSFDEMVRIDLDYIQSMNFWLDLKIMLLTPLEMLRGKGGG
jgi:lipopolysaccharide/colanic/teichoic acid biosynthesis glycosyltransferase